MRDVKDKKTGFYKYIGDKQKAKKNAGLLFNKIGDLVTQDVGKADVLNVSFASEQGQPSGIPSPIDQRERLENQRCNLSGESQVREHLSKLDI